MKKKTEKKHGKSDTTECNTGNFSRHQERGAFDALLTLSQRVNTHVLLCFLTARGQYDLEKWWTFLEGEAKLEHERWYACRGSTWFTNPSPHSLLPAGNGMKSFSHHICRVAMMFFPSTQGYRTTGPELEARISFSSFKLLSQVFGRS